MNALRPAQRCIVDIHEIREAMRVTSMESSLAKVDGFLALHQLMLVSCSFFQKATHYHLNMFMSDYAL